MAPLFFLPQRLGEMPHKVNKSKSPLKRKTLENKETFVLEKELLGENDVHDVPTSCSSTEFNPCQVSRDLWIDELRFFFKPASSKINIVTLCVCNGL
jgi:hypothetical protein